MSRMTVGNAIKPLLDRGLIIEREESTERSSAGRPGILVQLNPSGAYFVGIDVSTTAINAVLIDLTMTVIAKANISIAKDYRSPEKILDRFADLPEELLKKAGLRNKQLNGVGVSIPGIISNTGRVVSAPLLGWKDFDLQTALSKKFRSRWPVRVINDAVAFASAVEAETPDQELNDVLLILLTEGIGSAQIRHGRIVAGAHGFAGEIGHMVLGASMKLATTQTFENLAGYKQFLPLLPENRTIAEGLAELAKGDKHERKVTVVLDKWADALSTGLLNLIHIIDPERIVLGGPLGVLYPLVAKQVESSLASGLVYGFQVPLIGIAGFGGDVAAVGAAAAVREDLFTLPEVRSH
jgi:predicted NBD/HSP70 family sugar kinase